MGTWWGQHRNRGPAVTSARLVIVRDQANAAEAQVEPNVDVNVAEADAKVANTYVAGGAIAPLLTPAPGG